MPSDLGILMSTTFPHHLYSCLHHPHQTMLKNKVPSIASWATTVVQCALPGNHHYHLQWYSTNLPLCQIWLHPLLKLHVPMLTLVNNYSFSVEAYIEETRLISPKYPAKLHKEIPTQWIHIMTHYCKISKINSLQTIVHSQNAWNRLPSSFSKLPAITPIQIFNLFLTDSIMGQLVANTNSYTQQQLLGPEIEWQHFRRPDTA